MATINVFCKNTQEYIEIEGGTTLSEIASKLIHPLSFLPICALVNNKTEHLAFPVFSPKEIEFLENRSETGKRVYIRSLCMMLYKALTEVAPHLSLRIEHSISKGYLCRLIDREKKCVVPDDTLIEELKKSIERLVERDIPFERKELRTKDVREIFSRQGLDSEVRLLDSRSEIYTVFYTLDGLADSYYGPLAPSTGLLKVFNIIKYKEGFLLLGPDPVNRDVPAQPITQEKMYKAFREYLEFNNVIKVRDIGELNTVVRKRETARLINVAEAMHEKYIGAIASEIAKRNDKGEAKIVLLAGPSSSGKTTTTKKLAIHLITNLKSPKMISLDDYFVDREHSPRDEKGDYDYESLYALDLPRLNSDLRRLLAGEQINLPTYSFELGRRIERERPLRLEEDDVLLIEGIHGLNPELTASLPADRLFKVYVSSLTSLSIDDHNWISTTDTRLLRRIVRDHKYRHTTALETIHRWPGVRRGEEKWIFPYQENADATFNSSLIFELGVMKEYAMPLLAEVPHNVEEYSTAHRLMRFLSYFSPIPSDQIPATSLLREFLGGSSFKY